MTRLERFLAAWLLWLLVLLAVEWIANLPLHWGRTTAWVMVGAFVADLVTRWKERR